MAATTTASRENNSNSHSRSYSHSSRNESLNRNTLNQRASRARRKDYVNSLELKVREYEAQGVQATEQVQNAARHVAEENRVLKEEMRMLREQVRCLEEVLRRRDVRQSGIGGGDGVSNGCTDRDVELDAAWRRLQHEDRIRRWNQQQDQEQNRQHQNHDQWEDQRSDSTLLAVDDDVPGDVAAGQYPSPPGESREARGSPQRHFHAPIKTEHPARTLYDVYHDSNTDDGLQHSTPNNEPSNLNYHAFSDVWAQGQSLSYTTQASGSSTSTFPANTTPCEEAALIIASMRGVATSNSSATVDILPELGCCDAETSRSCTVDNVRLFSIMDLDRR